MKYPDTTILIQGPTNNKCLRYIDSYAQLAKIMFSCWDDNLPNTQFPVISTKFVNNPCCNPGNLYYQALTTYNGLKNINTDFTLKIRADDYFENLDTVIATIKNNRDKLTTAGIAFRHTNICAYHIADHILGSNTQYMLKTFKMIVEILHNKSHCSRLTPEDVGINSIEGWTSEHAFFNTLSAELMAEQMIMLCFIKSNNLKLDIHNHKTNFLDNIATVDTNTLGHYCFTANSIGKTFCSAQQIQQQYSLVNKNEDSL